MIDYNLLVSFREGREKEAEDEMIRRLTDAGERAEDWNMSADPQLYLVRVPQDPKKAVQKIRKLAEHFPDVFAYTMQWIPVDEWIEAEENTIRGTVTSYLEEMPGAEVSVEVLHSYRPDFQNRLESMSQKGSGGTVMVRVIGDTASISALQEDEWMDINQIREKVGLRSV